MPHRRAFPENIAVTGGLYAPTYPYGLKPSELPHRDDLYLEDAGEPGWMRLTLRSLVPLVGEVSERGSGPYLYEFLVRETRERFLLVSTHAKLVPYLLDRVNQMPLLRTPAVRVHDIVGSLSSKPDAYCMTAIWAKVNGYGQSLRTIALFGDDIAEAQLTREMLTRLVPYRVQLRDVRSRRDVLQIAAKGEIGFFYRDWATLAEVDACLRFLSMQSYLNWEDR